VLFNCGDADCELEALVDFVLLELGQFGVEAIYLPREVSLDAVNLCIEAGDVVLGRHVLDDMGEHFGNLFEAGFLCGHMREVYHGGRRGHECADGLDIAEHGNRKKSARILDAGIMRIGCDVHHGFRERTDAQGAGLSRRLLVGSGAPTAGETGI
jgi:hypothetical protein